MFIHSFFFQSMLAWGGSRNELWAEVRFNGKKAMQIMVSHFLDKQLCGLCGNFNGDASDDDILGDQCLPPGVSSGTEVIFFLTLTKGF